MVKEIPMSLAIRDMSLFRLEETVKLINKTGIALKCTIMTKIKALLIYHHFRACVPEINYDPYVIAAACIDLSIKYNDEKIPSENILFLLYSLVHPEKKQSSQTKHFRDTLRSVGMTELFILRMLEFDLDHTTAHQYLPYFMNDLKEELSNMNAWDVFAETCMRIASDFYLSNKCLIYKADEIAIAVIQVALYMIGANLDPDSYFQMKLKILNDCSEDKIQTIKEDIFMICFLGSHAESNSSNQRAV